MSTRLTPLPMTTLLHEQTTSVHPPDSIVTIRAINAQ